MPKNKGKGGKKRRRGKNENEVLKRELVEKDGDNQAYAQVVKMLGNGRLTAFCFDGKTRLCHIRGKLRKKVWIGAGDIILVGLRDYQDDKADVILKYTPDEARVLKNSGHLPESTKLNEGDEQNEGEVQFLDSGEKFDDDDVGEQHRNYLIDSDSDSDEDTDEDDNAEEDEEEEEDDAVEEEEDSRPEADDVQKSYTNRNLLDYHENRSSSKPGAREKYGRATKGKKGK